MLAARKRQLPTVRPTVHTADYDDAHVAVGVAVEWNQHGGFNEVVVLSVRHRDFFGRSNSHRSLI
jgi:hypothetical protein